MSIFQLLLLGRKASTFHIRRAIKYQRKVVRQVLRVGFKRVASIFKSMRPVSHKKPFESRAVVGKGNSFRRKVHLSVGFMKESSKESSLIFYSPRTFEVTYQYIGILLIYFILHIKVTNAKSDQCN